MAAATVYAPNKTDADKLAAVKSEMGRLGSPKIRAYWTGDAWQAIEGSHRIAAACELGLPVEIVEVGHEDMIPAGEHDYDGGYDEMTVAQLIEAYYSCPEAVYEVEAI